MALTKHSERNLNVILNFLLYAGLEDEYTQTAHDYIAEDHVDGEDSDEAHKEIALSSELIRESVEIENSIADNYDIYYSDVTKLIYAVSDNPGSYVMLYQLTKEQELIETEHRDEILDYCLSVKTKEDEVCLGDIFVHGKYIKRLN